MSEIFSSENNDVPPSIERALREEAERAKACWEFESAITGLFQVLRDKAYLEKPVHGIPIEIDFTQLLPGGGRHPSPVQEQEERPRAIIQYGNQQSQFFLRMPTPHAETYALTLSILEQQDDIANPDGVMASIDEVFYKDGQEVQRLSLELRGDATVTNAVGMPVSTEEIMQEVDFINSHINPELAKEEA